MSATIVKRNGMLHIDGLKRSGRVSRNGEVQVIGFSVKDNEAIQAYSDSLVMQKNIDYALIKDKSENDVAEYKAAAVRTFHQEITEWYAGLIKPFEDEYNTALKVAFEEYENTLREALLERERGISPAKKKLDLKTKELKVTRAAKESMLQKKVTDALNAILDAADLRIIESHNQYIEKLAAFIIALEKKDGGA